MILLVLVHFFALAWKKSMFRLPSSNHCILEHYFSIDSSIASSFANLVHCFALAWKKPMFRLPSCSHCILDHYFSIASSIARGFFQPCHNTPLFNSWPLLDSASAHRFESLHQVLKLSLDRTKLPPIPMYQHGL